MRRDPLLVAILGPTGSGKTALSIALADQFNGEIVNCDSVALYRDFVIGTAKPSPDERSRAPHHLFDIIDPATFTTAGEYARRARAVLREIVERGAMPIVVGGTGLYLRALLEGLFAGPERSEELRERLRELAQRHGSSYLHRILRKLDAIAAEKIHANDIPKLIRAIEVCLAARRPITQQWQEGREPLQGFRIIKIGLHPMRAQLYDRINQRVIAMFEAGLVEETKVLLDRYGESAKPLTSIGYREVVQLLKGELSPPETVAAVQQAHRNYAKRQATWFRREKDVRWIESFGDAPEAQRAALELVRPDIA